MEKTLKEHGKKLICLPDNLIDAIWTSDNRPPAPSGRPVFSLDTRYAGATVTQKLAGIRTAIAKAHCWGASVSALDEVAWLLNLRGGDIPFNPVFFSYALVLESECILYVDDNKLETEVGFSDYLLNVALSTP